MYYPYVRGKQFELLMLRELASDLVKWGFTPIIEPVKKNYPSLIRALDALCQENCPFVLLANPSVGDFKHDNTLLVEQVIKDFLADYQNFSVGIHLSPSDTIDTIRDHIDTYCVRHHEMNIDSNI